MRPITLAAFHLDQLSEQRRVSQLIPERHIEMMRGESDRFFDLFFSYDCMIESEEKTWFDGGGDTRFFLGEKSCAKKT